MDIVGDSRRRPAAHHRPFVGRPRGRRPGSPRSPHNKRLRHGNQRRISIYTRVVVALLPRTSVVGRSRLADSTRPPLFDNGTTTAQPETERSLLTARARITTRAKRKHIDLLLTVRPELAGALARRIIDPSLDAERFYVRSSTKYAPVLLTGTESDDARSKSVSSASVWGENVPKAFPSST